MIIGIPKEVKDNENRVGMVPNGVSALVQMGHQVIVSRGAGAGCGLSDETYEAAGATMYADNASVYGAADLIVKVKEPLAEEYELLREGQSLFTYLHLAAEPALAEALQRRNVTAIAYELVEVQGQFPLLKPMSEIAGRLSVQAGAHFLEKPQGGSGVLLGGTPGVPPGKVVVMGGGIVGTQAARIALGLGADVTIVDLNLERLRYLDELFQGRVRTLASVPAMVADAVKHADLLIGSVLVPGNKAPKVITEEMIQSMSPGSVVVDVAIDQGGCIATSRPTTHSDPVFTLHGVVHYCVTNMPGGVARTATMALTNATLPYIQLMARNGVVEALRHDANLRKGLNTHAGRVTHPAVASALNAPYTEPEAVLG